MSKLERALYELGSIERQADGQTLLCRLDARSKLLATLLFLVCVLSFGADELPRLTLSFAWPVVWCALGGMGYVWLFRRSLIVLPFVFFVGLFNPLFDHRPAFRVGSMEISVGWLSFVAILLRGLVAAQALFALVRTTGLHRLGGALHRLGLPNVMVSQLLFVHRYLFVLLQEALSMERARAARGFGRKSYPLKLWGVFVGQLLLRTVNRSERIHRAMLSRGFNGTLPLVTHGRWKLHDTLFLAVCTLFCLGLFFV